MLAPLDTYVGYFDGTSRSTHNLSSAAWVIYDLNVEVVILQGIRIDLSTNNIDEYIALIELLSNVISHGICHIFNIIDSQLIVLQMTSVYSTRSSTVLCMFLRFHLLEIYFDLLQYQHISRNLNTLTNALDNHVLDTNL